MRPVKDTVMLMSVLTYSRENMVMGVDMTLLPKRRAPVAPPNLSVLVVRDFIIDKLARFFLDSPIAQLRRTP